ncbi:hypothetical protein [Tautonia rosea]|uniref:hypothetical protein n=1 Tax=Tautonia rosea TaxID=2728037 RepID=UPI001473E541|nr:hypothetical protein [Tautonia rosea]
MKTNHTASLMAVFFVAVLTIVAGADGFRPSVSQRLLQLEMELEETLERAELAEAEAAELAIELAEAVETLEVEQAHREQAERRLAECLENRASDK